jgi:hypothetical protein
MKAFSVFALIFLIASSVHAQIDRWRIVHNGNLLLSDSVEDESRNVRQIKRTEFDKPGNLSIEYTSSIPNDEWQRTFSLVDDKDSVLYEKAGGNLLTISNSNLKKYLAKENKFKIYTWSLPKDSSKAALIRIRRIHLCTIEIN